MISRLAVPTRPEQLLTVVMMTVLAASLTWLAPTIGMAGDRDDRDDWNDRDDRRDEATWSMSGQGITNWRFQPGEKKLSPRNVGRLKTAWVASLAGDISATPAVVDGEVYVPDWGGKIWKLDAKTGAVIWSKSVSAITGIPDTGFPRSISRTSPAVVNDVVVFGSQAGAWLIALKRKTGELKWKVQLDPHPTAVVTQSPTVHKEVVYVGVASQEEAVVSFDLTYQCCTFRGSMLAVSLANGKIKWKTYTTSNDGVPGGYAGASVWGSSPAIDEKRRRVYVGTGNNFDAPQTVKDCVSAPGGPYYDMCEPQGNGNHVDAVLALDMKDGHIIWSHKLQGYDAWNVACIPPPFSVPGAYELYCPQPTGPDYDFAQGPMLIQTAVGDIVAAGQKSGMFWGLNPNDGSIIWSRNAGPGSTLGGMEWGSATDGHRIYYAVANFNFQQHVLVNPPAGTPLFTIAGFWGALDAATGAVLWQTADPNTTLSPAFNVAVDIGPVSVANGVVYVGSMAGFPGATTGRPTMFALDAATGAQLWSFASGGSVNASPAIVDGTLYWGSGFSNFNLGDASNKLYSFSR